jgi:dTDP-4-amino-4,6-dideoxygalactose transaminase
MNITNKGWIRLIRLPIYPDLKRRDVDKILNSLKIFFKKNNI